MKFKTDREINKIALESNEYEVNDGVIEAPAEYKETLAFFGFKEHEEEVIEVKTAIVKKGKKNG